MKLISSILLSIIILVSAFLLSGGVYRFESIEPLVAHRLNIITGKISLCVMHEGCREFSEPGTPVTESFPEKIQSGKWPLYPFEYYRKLPAYDDWGNEELATAIFNKYIEESGVEVSKIAFFEVIGYEK